MSATLNMIGLVTLLTMSAALLNGAGIPVGTYAHAALGTFSGWLNSQLSNSL
jgi:hypothetical protein